MLSYKDELQRATDLLASNNYLFLGQNTRFGGTSLFHMIKHLPESQRWELPVFEDVQMGMSIGMALSGVKVCSVFPRMDFLILAINQLVNHADRVRLMSDGQFTLKGLIIRSAIGSVKPLFPGEQHSGDYCEAIQKMCKEIKVVKLDQADTIYPEYERAIDSEVPTLLVEIPDLYNAELTDELIQSRKEIIK
jgi:pyruvate/2-oxoglutarate/acetoin dehydrogenase E1 component